jgi:uncharacterized protein (TIGR03067 family)
MRCVNRLVGLAVVLLCGCAAKPQPPDPQLILGEWVVVDFQSPQGTEDRGQRRKHAKISEGTWSQQFQGDEFEDFEYSLDPTKTPKEIDLTDTDPNGHRRTVRGIYELTKDRLRLCLGTPPVVQKGGKAEYVESVRPTAFDPTRGIVITYHRKTG